MAPPSPIVSPGVERYSSHDGQDNSLEDIEGDGFGKAPEVNTHSLAPEVDIGSLAPEVYCRSHPGQVKTAPGVLESALSDCDNEKSKTAASKRQFKRLTNFRILVICLVVTALVALGVGVGVGVWRHRRSKIGASLPESSPGTQVTQLHAILRDTSLGATVLNTGDRLIFFQENSGTVRYASRSTETGRWSTGINKTITSKAKMYSPLSIQLATPSNFSAEQVGIYYITPSHSVSSAKYGNGIANDDTTEFEPIQGYTCDPETRSLAYLPLSDTTDDAYLFLERPGGSVSVLLSRYLQDGTNQDTSGSGRQGPDVGRLIVNGTQLMPNLQWRDLGDEEIEISPEDGSYASSNITFTIPGSGQDIKAPFGGVTLTEPPSTASWSAIISFYNPQGSYKARSGIIQGRLKGGNYGEFQSTRFLPPYKTGDPVPGPAPEAGLVYNDSAIKRSDFVQPIAYQDGPIILPGLWVNGSTLNSFFATDAKPEAGVEVDFPYTRLATTTPKNSPTFYLYHQINDTTIAERAWTLGAADWRVEYITVDIE